MNQSDFTQYLRTTNKNDVDDLIDLLKQYNIQFELENYPANFNSTFNVDINTLEYLVKLKSSDFNMVDKIEFEYYQGLTKNISSDYYLYNFTDSELREILEKSDEWSKFDLILAKQLLAARRVKIDSKDIERLRKERLEKLSEPEKSQTFWVVIGYISAFAGGLLGILIGSHLLSHKRTLPNGDKVHDYNEKDRKHGSAILLIGIAVLILSGLRFIFRMMD